MIKTLVVIMAMLLYNVTAYCQGNKQVLPNGSSNGKKFIISKEFIRLQNGTELSAMIARYESDTVQVPALLIASCYPQTYNDVSVAKLGLRKGFAGVVVYSRGKEKSGGTFEPFEHEAEDLHTVIDWVSKQPWCNGKVGMFGGSYLGFSQWAACKKLHPALKTIVPQVAAAPGIDYPMYNGIFMPYMLRWINYTTNQALNDARNFYNRAYWDTIYSQYYKYGLAFNRLDSLDKKPDSIFQRWLRHPGYDSYWANMIPSTPEEYAAINIPILTITGYFDDDQRGAFYYYNMHNKYGSAEAVSNHYLLIGPWDHSGAQAYPGKNIGNYKVDSLALIPVLDIVMDWFEYTLKGKNKPAFLKDRVNYFVMSDGWKHAPSLEKMNRDSLVFYLTGRAASSFYLLARNGDKKNRSLDIKYNPKDHFEIEAPGEDPSPLGDEYIKNRGQLVFQTAPLPNDIEINGSPVTDLFLSIQQKDIDLRLDFYEVTPDNKSFMLSTFLQRASYYSNRDKRQLITPGKINHYHFTNSFFTSKLVKKGSVIRVVVKPLNSRYWQKNYGTGKEVSSETMADAKPFSGNLFIGEKYKSSITLPCNILN